MAFIRSRKKSGHTYYYLVESYRENGKVKQRVLEYIGTFDKLKQMALDKYTKNSASKENISTSITKFKTAEHGAVTALRLVAEKIGLKKILDESFSSKTIKGLPRSNILILAMIQRAVKPGSKKEFSDWVANTSLPYHYGFKAKDLTSASFWEAMDNISEQEIEDAWNLIIKKLFQMYNLDITKYHLDYTNYFTYINSTNGRCFICKRGYNKQKRNDLLQFNLAALTSKLLTVPIVWEIYEGNINDKTELPIFANRIKQQLKKLDINPEEVTITFDGGGNSQETLSNIGFNFICAHSLASHKELYDIDINQYEKVSLSNEKTRMAYLLKDFEFSGVKGQGVLIFSENLKNGQLAELSKDEEKINARVEDLQDKLKNSRSKLYTELSKHEHKFQIKLKEVQDHNNKVDAGELPRKKHRKLPVFDDISAMEEILSQKLYKGRTYFKQFTSIEVLQADDGLYTFNYQVNDSSKATYIEKFYGKKLIATNRTDLSVNEILNEYVDQECIENDIFRISKNTDHFSVRPQYHWTDQKIKVHIFICLASIVLAEVLQIHLKEHGISLSKSKMIDQLREIREGWVYDNNNKPTKMLETMDDDHSKLWECVEKLR